MRLVVGISEETPGWKIVLQQIGVPYEKVNSDRLIHADAFAVLIVNHLEKKQDTKYILEYLNNGGSVLVEADVAKQFLPQKVKWTYLKTLHVEDAPFFSHSIDCDLFRWSQVAADANHNKKQEGKSGISVSFYGKGTVVVLPSGFVSSLISIDVKQKFFYSEYGERLPSEKVSKVSKGGIRHIIQSTMEYLYHRRGVPFVHLWYFPKGEKNVFVFRVDTDYGTQQEVDELYSVCRGNRIQATWFVETKSQEPWIRFYRSMKDQEIGYHCYRHRIFSDYQTNKENIVEGLNILHNAGIHPKGYAAPYGEWNPALGKVLQEMQFEYSSEFGLDYDDLPFYPYLDNSFSTVFQVPIHPISIGNLRRARHTQGQIVSYYRSMIKQKLVLGDPISIYHHPGHQCFDVIHTLFCEIQQQNIPSMTMGDFNEWWKRRIRIGWMPEYRDQKFYFDVQNGDASVYLRAVLPEEKYAVFSFRNVIDPGKLDWKKQNRLSPVRCSRFRNQDAWRLMVYRMENIYGKWRS